MSTSEHFPRPTASRRRPLGVRRSHLLILLLLPLAACATIRQDEIGVKTRFGRISSGPLQPGAQLVIPGVNSVLEEDVIIPVFRSAAADVSARYMAKHLHSGTPAGIESAIRTPMMSVLDPRGFNVENVLLESIRLPQDSARSIEDRLEAARRTSEATGIRDSRALRAQGLTPASAVAQRASSGAIAPTRIAVFDSRVVLDSLPQRNAVESEFALEQSKARVLVAAASDSLRLALDELVQAEQRLTQREREAGKLQLRARELLVEQMIENLDGVMQQRVHELRGPLMAQLRAAVRSVRLRLQYDLVLDRASDDLIADADDRVDITQEIIQELRKSHVLPPPSERSTPATKSREIGARP